jgi:hypothetical protein
MSISIRYLSIMQVLSRSLLVVVATLLNLLPALPAGAVDAAGRARLLAEAASRHQRGEDMDCPYPAKHSWWQSLSAGTLTVRSCARCAMACCAAAGWDDRTSNVQVLQTKNPGALQPAARCIGFQDVASDQVGRVRHPSAAGRRCGKPRRSSGNRRRWTR